MRPRHASRKGGSSQDRRRARRAAAREAAATAIEVPADGTVATVEGDGTGEALPEIDADAFSALATRALPTSPERAALESVRETFLKNPTCRCGHPYAEHTGADGPCNHEDGRGVCSCDGFSELSVDPVDEGPLAPVLEATVAAAAPAGVTLSLSFEEGASDALAEVLATRIRVDGGGEAPAEVIEAAVHRLRAHLENFQLADPLAELAPAEEMPPANPSPAAPDVEAPSREARLGLAWVADFVPEGRLTDDGRAMAPGSLTWRELPLSLMAQLETQEGHDGARVCGRIDQIWRDQNGMIRASGVFDEGEFGLEVARMVADGVLRGVSVDLAIHDYEVGPKSDWFDEDGNWAPKEAAADREEPSLLDLLLGEGEETIFVVTEAVIGTSTICSFPAFADASIEIANSLVAGSAPGADLLWTVTQQAGFRITQFTLADAPAEPDYRAEAAAIVASVPEPTDEQLADYAAFREQGLSEREACSRVWPDVDWPETITASAAGIAPVRPPAEWFEDPELVELTPLTVTDDGRIFGHAWAWDTCHIGIPDVCTVAPHSRTGNAYFHLKEVECEDGERIPCGTVTLETGHADRRLARVAATAHYDDTGLAVADVRCGEDEFGGWVAGALRPDVDAERARDLRGAVLSGDWRNVDGNLELVALLAVNVPGFPVPRPRALVAAGDDGAEVLALVAAGTVIGEEHLDADDLAKIRQLGEEAVQAMRFATLAARAAA